MDGRTAGWLVKRDLRDRSRRRSGEHDSRNNTIVSATAAAVQEHRLCSVRPLCCQHKLFQGVSPFQLLPIVLPQVDSFQFDFIMGALLLFVPAAAPQWVVHFYNEGAFTTLFII